MYDKKIAYLHYVENGEMKKNVGHVKLTCREKNKTMELFLRNMSECSSGEYPIHSLSEGGKVDTLSIQRGQASFKKTWNVDSEFDVFPVIGIRIVVSETAYVEAVWGAQEIPVEPMKHLAEIVQEEAPVQISEMPPKEPEASPEKERNLTFSVPQEVYENKWSELCKKYDVVSPFGNGETYLKIAPQDFIIFPEKYQNLVHNSFLLHGYYNYQHIILGQKEERGKSIYYLGVPGVYYEREKMVAIMFGFEGFECGDKKIGNGAFGYYMRRVEL